MFYSSGKSTDILVKGAQSGADTCYGHTWAGTMERNNPNALKIDSRHLCDVGQKGNEDAENTTMAFRGKVGCFLRLSVWRVLRNEGSMANCTWELQHGNPAGAPPPPPLPLPIPSTPRAPRTLFGSVS